MAIGVFLPPYLLSALEIMQQQEEVAKVNDPFNPADWDFDLVDPEKSRQTPVPHRNPGFRLEDLRSDRKSEQSNQGSKPFLKDSIFLESSRVTATQVAAGAVVATMLGRHLFAARVALAVAAHIHPVLLGVVVLGGVAALLALSARPEGIQTA